MMKVPKKKYSRFRRGSLTPCLILSPGEKNAIFQNLRKEENILSFKQENQKFLVVASPALEIDINGKSIPCYVCDSEKGVTVNLSFDREQELSTLFCDPKLVSNVFDESFISKASGIKADYKQLIGIAFMGFVFGGLLGLMF